MFCDGLRLSEQVALKEISDENKTFGITGWYGGTTCILCKQWETIGV